MADELSQMVKDMLDGTKEELKALIPSFDLSPEIDDRKVKQAILDLTPEGMKKLFKQFDQTEVTKFITEFSRGRRW